MTELTPSLIAYHADAVYKFSINDEPGNSESSIRQSRVQSPIIPPNRKRRKLFTTAPVREVETAPSTSYSGPALGTDHANSAILNTDAATLLSPTPESFSSSTAGGTSLVELRAGPDIALEGSSTQQLAGTRSTTPRSQEHATTAIERYLDQYSETRSTSEDPEIALSPLHNPTSSMNHHEPSSLFDHDIQMTCASAPDGNSGAGSLPSEDSSFSSGEMDVEREMMNDADDSEDALDLDSEEERELADLIEMRNQARALHQAADTDESYTEASDDDDGFESDPDAREFANHWLCQPIVYPTKRYSGLCNVEVSLKRHSYRITDLSVLRLCGSRQ